MRIFLFCLLFLFFIQKVNCQSFPENNPSVLVGAELRVVGFGPNFENNGYPGFFSDSLLIKVYKCCLSTNSNFDSLYFRNFKVKSAYKNLINPGPQNFILVLEDEEGEKVFFEYKSKRPKDFPFEVLTKIDFPSDYYCSQIVKEKDKFSDEVTFSNTYFEGVKFVKIVSGSITSNYIILKASGRTANVGEKGVVLLFNDGTVWRKPEAAVDLEINSDYDGFEYYSIIKLNDSDVKLFSQKKITDFRLFIFEVSVKDGERLKNYAKCIFN